MARFTQDQLLEAYRRAPEQIQNAFGGEIMINVVNDIKNKFRLHIDVAGNLEREIGYLMLGLISPAEFFGALMLSGTDEASARGIMEEVNNGIFIPLRREVAGSAKSPIAPGSYAEAQPQPEPVRPSVPPPSVDYEAPKTLPGSPVPAPMPITETVTVATPSISAEREVFKAPTIQEVTVPEIRLSPQTQQTGNAPGINIPLTKDYATDPYREPI